MNNSFFVKSLNLCGGVVVYDDFDIDEAISFEEQWYNYKEDILQIKFGERLLLDVGWHPENNPKGQFFVVAIIDEDWMNPLLKIKCSNLEQLRTAIDQAAFFINEKRKNCLC